jgi:hypothetical protein
VNSDFHRAYQTAAIPIISSPANRSYSKSITRVIIIHSPTSIVLPEYRMLFKCWLGQGIIPIFYWEGHPRSCGTGRAISHSSSW